MPEGTPQALRRGCRAMLAAAIPLCAVSVTGMIQGWAWPSMSNVHDAVVITLILAGAWWGDAQQHDDQVRALIRQNGDFYRRIPEGDRPPLLRATSGR